MNDICKALQRALTEVIEESRDDIPEEPTDVYEIGETYPPYSIDSYQDNWAIDIDHVFLVDHPSRVSDDDDVIEAPHVGCVRVYGVSRSIAYNLAEIIVEALNNNRT
jgi:hypothetical protein